MRLDLDGGDSNSALVHILIRAPMSSSTASSQPLYIPNLHCPVALRIGVYKEARVSHGVV